VIHPRAVLALVGPLLVVTLAACGDDDERAEPIEGPSPEPTAAPLPEGPVEERPYDTVTELATAIGCDRVDDDGEARQPDVDRPEASLGTCSLDGSQLYLRIFNTESSFERFRDLTNAAACALPEGTTIHYAEGTLWAASPEVFTDGTLVSTIASGTDGDAIAVDCP
jgi:hypothetical protein